MDVRRLAKRAGLEVAAAEQILRTNWTTELLAAASGITPQAVRKACRSGEIAAEKPGRDWIISREAGDTWLKARGVNL